MGSTGKSYSIQAVEGNLDYSQARHLLDRCIFGAGKEEVTAMAGKSISSALYILMQSPALPTPPVSVDARDTDAATLSFVSDGDWSHIRIYAMGGQAVKNMGRNQFPSISLSLF